MKVMASQYLNCGYLPITRMRRVWASSACTPAKPSASRRSSQGSVRAPPGRSRRSAWSRARRRSP
ncbi:Uncharacterised protein [Bordetella pertussis]|nr:Uncharacterised protein [Bordetella pertussis]